MLYWPEFEFDFRVDAQRLLPHIAAIEGFKEASSNRVLPPQWREQPADEEAERQLIGLPQEHKPAQNRIDLRKQELLQRNTNATQAWVRERFTPGSTLLSMADILAMHRMVGEETGVRYRNDNSLRTAGVQVGRREVGGLHAGAPPEKLPRLMDRYVEFINSENLQRFPPVLQAIVAHFFFTTIHPFDDGNGRVSRLISAGILFQRGYNGHGFHALSNYFYQNDIKYHSLLHQCWQQPLPFDLTFFVAFGIEGLAMELQGISSFVRVKLHRSVDGEGRRGR